MAERFSEIKDDRTFEQYLARALVLLADPTIMQPISRLAPSFEAQLRFMQGFARDGRKPSQAERDSINAGLLWQESSSPLMT